MGQENKLLVTHAHFTGAAVRLRFFVIEKFRNNFLTKGIRFHLNEKKRLHL